MMLLFALSLWALACTARSATVGIAEDLILFASDGATSDMFGSCVATDGDILLIGAQGDGGNRGSGYVFVTSDGGDTWVEQSTKLSGSDSTGGDIFGYACDVSGDFAVVGAPTDDNALGTDAGSVYFFETSDGGTSWLQVGHQSATGGAAFDQFGEAVAISGDLAIACSRWYDGEGTNSGRCFVYMWNSSTFVYQQGLEPSANAQDNHFGYSVSLDGQIAAIGALFDDVPPSGFDQGSVTVFTTTTGVAWFEQETLEASDKADQQQLGISVAVSGNYLVAGRAGPSGSTGNALVYVTTDGGVTYTEKQILGPSDGAADDQFSRVAVDGDFIVVGAPEDTNGQGSKAGAIYSFETADGGDTWSETYKITASFSTGSSQFGLHTAIFGGLAVTTGPLHASSLGNGFTVRVDTAGAGGDPVLVDFAGHRFMAGHSPGQRLLLLKHGRDVLTVRTGDVLGRENGFFLDSLLLTRAGCGSVTVQAQHDRLGVTVTGDPCMMSAVAEGDNGLVALSLDGGNAILAVKAHHSSGFGFLNVKFASVSTALRRGCVEGILCNEAHAASLKL